MNTVCISYLNVLPIHKVIYFSWFRHGNSVSSGFVGFQDLASSTTQTDMLIMDFSKAFDKVPHKRLNYKLNWYGIRGDTLEWITDFLCPRSQSATSDSAPVLSGVPLGTVPGPILFLIYGVVNSTVRLFADDCIIYHPIRCKKDTELLQSDLNSVDSWEKTWLMLFNADKCFTMRTGRSKSKINASYNLHDQPLQSTDSVKYFGLTLTSDLKFNSHINNVTAKANSLLGLLCRNLKILSQAVKTQAYQSLVRPHLEYASTVWSTHTSDNIKKVEMVQRRAARYDCNRWHNTSSVSKMVSHLGWESLAVRRSNMRLHTMYRIVRQWEIPAQVVDPIHQTNTRIPSVEVYSTEPVK